MAINKVIYGGETLIDLTGDTITAERMLKGSTAHDKSGEVIEGACEFDVNSTDATATAAEMLFGKTAYARGTKLEGTMVNRGAISGTISERDEKFVIQMGYHDGSGGVTIDETEKEKIIPNNIRNGVTILGIVGSMTGAEEVTSQSKTVTPSTVQQTVLPDSNVNYLSQVIVNAISYVESANSAGGTTVTIAG